MTLVVCTTSSHSSLQDVLGRVEAADQAVHLVVTHRPFFLEAQDRWSRFPRGSTLSFLVPEEDTQLLLPVRGYSFSQNHAGGPLEGRMWCAQPRVRRLLHVKRSFVVLGEFMVALASSVGGLSESEFVLRQYSSLEPGAESPTFWRRVGGSLDFLEGKDCATLLDPVLVSFPVGAATVFWVKELRSDYVGAKWWRGPCARFKARDVRPVPAPQVHGDELFVVVGKK